jgi:hypothetical protein
MECYTCRQDEPELYHVKLRGDVLATRPTPLSKAAPIPWLIANTSRN